MTGSTMNGERHLGLFGATTLGVGAIVGGGILALAGIAFATTGPSAIIAFALNGVIACLTIVSFAQLARRFPESGGTYTYAKKVLSIEVAFVVGWVVWFASIVAGVLYAIGFAVFLSEGLHRLLPLLGWPVAWLDRPIIATIIAVGATTSYTILLLRRTAAGGRTVTIGKVVVFVVLLAAGGWVWIGESPAELLGRLSPFVSAGPVGLLQAMGYTFIALQGFDLIATVSGEVKDPVKTVPRAMYLSLGIALTIYLPLLFLLATVGSPETGITTLATASPERLVADAVERYMGSTGYWLVIGAGVLSMLSALHANLFGASRVAFAMARDRTLPHPIGRMHGSRGTPAVAVVATGAMVVTIVMAVGNVAAAGAASSLIFLISFATVHWAAILARRRSGEWGTPIVPILGATLCLGLALFQAFAVPEAGAVIALWLAIGITLYLTLLAPSARLADASAEARDPDLARLRGRSPLVLVPIANPESAASLVDVAATVRTPGSGRILLLSALQNSDENADVALSNAQAILGESLARSLESSFAPETLFTIASDTWSEIARVARGHRCETVLLGLSKLMKNGIEAKLEGLIAELDADVVIVRAPHRWRMAEAERVLVPLGGRRDHSHLRARLLASLSRSSNRSVTFLMTLPTATEPDTRRRFEHVIRELAREEAAGPYEVVFEYTDEPREAIIKCALDSDLVVMGTQRSDRGQPALGKLPLAIAQETDLPLVLIARRPNRSPRLLRTGLTGRFSTRGILR